MLCIKLSLILLFVFTSSLFAAEGENAEKKRTEPSPSEEYTVKTTKLNMLEGRIEETSRQYDSLVKEKAREKDQNRVQELLRQMVDLDKQRNKDRIEFAQVKQELLYKYPAMTEQLNRDYSIKEKDPDQEGAGGLDELLTRTKKVIQRKFAPFTKDDEELKAKTPPPEKPKRLVLEK